MVNSALCLFWAGIKVFQNIVLSILLLKNLGIRPYLQKQTRPERCHPRLHATAWLAPFLNTQNFLL